jgi:hypothetical protein
VLGLVPSTEPIDEATGDTPRAGLKMRVLPACVGKLLLKAPEEVLWLSHFSVIKQHGALMLCECMT